MDKIDRLGWAAGFSFISYGVKVGVRTNSPEVLDRLRDFLPPRWDLSNSRTVDRLYSLRVGGAGARPGMKRFNLLYGDLARLARSLELNDLFESFESDLQLYVAGMARKRVFIHAGVVGWKGQAIIIPGRTFTGKTTLVAELVRAGATYYSDEYAVLDARGRVHPYPKPLGIRDNETARQIKCTVDSLGGSTGTKPLRVGLVVVSEYQSGARWRPKHLSAGQATLVLLNNTVAARRQPAVTLAALQQLVEGAKVLKGKRGEATEIVASIIHNLSNRQD